MEKITKKEYDKLKAELQEQIKTITNKIEALDEWGSNLDYNHITDKQKEKFDKIGDYWNSLYDKQRELEQEIKFLEDQWDRRNWTGSDWNSWELVTSNID